MAAPDQGRSAALVQSFAFFPRGSWLSPAALCRALLRHPNITLHHNAAATSCERIEGNWHVKTAGGDEFAAYHCCIATAQDAAAFFPKFGLRLHAVGGQVSAVMPPSLLPLRTILCHKGYAIPLGERLLIGATYNHGDDALAVTEENHRKNLEEATHFLPVLAEAQVVSGRTSLRATTPDRLPYVGALGEGLWISAGHGSRGMLSAPLAAEAIASAIAGEQAPLIQALHAAVDPLRFKA